MDTLEGLMKKFNFSPQLIFNFDETAFDFSTLKLKVVSCASKPCLFVEMTEKGEHISLGLCISAFGHLFQLLVILPL
jgi:hypothetical protein